MLEDLNSIQQQAVETTQGPLLLLSGAGTGKTKVLTNRIVNILNQNLAYSSQILAVTFTNKAATEMKHRIENILHRPVDGFWIGTFHSIGLRILRRHVAEVGLKENFTIIDTADSERLIKEILVERNVDTTKNSPTFVYNTIARFKDKNISPQSVPNALNVAVGSVQISTIYEEYQTRLKQLNCVDFGDLIYLCVDLFKQFPDVLALWQGKFKYIMVDEYQDTNVIQYTFVKILSLPHNNIFCVGDDDQSIYSWRGAEIDNILRFEKDFPNAKVLYLEQNYRSTNSILNAASSLIAKNSSRYSKKLWSDKADDSKIIIKECFNSKQEADILAQDISLLNQNGGRYENTAVLVRAMYLTREIEEKLIAYSIPYKIFGGAKFYDRLEIKDACSYLRLVVQKYDDLAFMRAISAPKRGIGETSIAKLRDYARSEGLSLFNASQKLVEEIFDSKIISSKIKNQLQEFIALFNAVEDMKATARLSEMLNYILNTSGYIDILKAENSPESKSRLENLKELASALDGFNNLEEFLEHISLINETEDKNDNNSVILMTIHAAKGLEFEAVFLPGFEEGIIPSPRSIDENAVAGLEEERRLAYVAITRAKKFLQISFCNNRYMYGSYQSTMGSRFLNEVDEGSVKRVALNNYNPNTYSFNQQQSILNSTSFGSSGGSYHKSNFNKNSNISNNNNDADHNKAKFKIGAIVQHATLGQGMIIALEGSIATVKFNNTTTKKIITDFLKLVG